MTDLLHSILKRHDRGEHVAEIAAAEDVGFGYVYGILREHRPDRKRKPRERNGEMRKKVLRSLSHGSDVKIADKLGCTRQYVYKIRQESKVPPPPF